LLTLLMENRFPRIWVADAENRDLRQLLWHRHRLVQMRTRVMNQLHVVALNEGLRRKKALWRPAGRSELESNVFAVTIEIGPRTAHASPPPVPDQANTAAWANAWTNLLNDARQSFIPSRPRMTSAEVELVVANPGPSQDSVTLTVLNSTGEPLVQVSRVVQAANCSHVVFTFPNGGLALSLGRVYYVQLVGGDLFGWKYTEGGYKNGAASFNGKPLMSARNGNFLFRTYADD